MLSSVLTNCSTSRRPTYTLSNLRNYSVPMKNKVTTHLIFSLLSVDMITTCIPAVLNDLRLTWPSRDAQLCCDAVAQKHFVTKSHTV